MPEDIEVKVTTKRQAEVGVTLGPKELTLKGSVEDGRAPYVEVYEGSTITFRIVDFSEADWPAFREAVDKLFAALRPA